MQANFMPYPFANSNPNLSGTPIEKRLLTDDHYVSTTIVGKQNVVTCEFQVSHITMKRKDMV